MQLISYNSCDTYAVSEDVRFELNGDKLMNELDIANWLSTAASRNGFATPYLLGGTDLDGSVDSGDLNSLALSWTQTSDKWSEGDFNADGVVNSSDLNALALNWQSFSVAAAVHEVVSEPMGMTILLLAVIGGWAQNRPRMALSLKR